MLRRYLTPKTKGLILNSPCNPTGAVYTPAELEDLARVLLDTDLFIITDEIYEHIIYDGLKQISIATLDPALKSALDSRQWVLEGLCHDRLAARLLCWASGGDRDV